ncbi:MAG: ABC transporter ATP-binding protein [Fluviicola sp.]|nr:ABC transporter ATP-binding protein [Fluviicola sp.]
MQEVLIDIKELSKVYKSSERPSLDSVSFSVLKGEKFGVFGPNGAGKTTLISILCNLLQASSGSVLYHINNQQLNAKSILKSIGFVPQDFAFYPELTPVQNLRYFGSLYEIPKQQLQDKIDFLLSKMGLESVKNKKVQSFSGGMKRRINLAIALINDPEILFLDEPTVGVDVQSKVAIFSILEELNHRGTTIIYTSHHLKEAEDFCDRIVLLDNGEIIAINDMQSLFTENNVQNLEELLIKLTGKTFRD